MVEATAGRTLLRLVVGATIVVTQIEVVKHHRLINTGDVFNVEWLLVPGTPQTGTSKRFNACAKALDPGFAYSDPQSQAIRLKEVTDSDDGLASHSDSKNHPCYLTFAKT